MYSNFSDPPLKGASNRARSSTAQSYWSRRASMAATWFHGRLQHVPSAAPLPRSYSSASRLNHPLGTASAGGESVFPLAPAAIPTAPTTTEDWRDASQTMALETSTSQSDSSRLLVPRGPRRPSARRPADTPPDAPPAPLVASSSPQPSLKQKRQQYVDEQKQQHQEPEANNPHQLQPETALQTDPWPPSAAQLQHQIRHMRVAGQLAAALDLSYTGISSHPHVRSFWASAASLECRMGRLELAMEVAMEGLRRWPGNPALLLARGQVAAAGGDIAEARASFEAALQREPGNAAVLHAWAMAEAAAGNVPAARRLFRTASRADPDMFHTYTAWGRLEAAAGDEAAARRVFEEGHVANPTHVPLLHAWARFELQHDKQSVARRLLEQALQLHPQHMPSWMSLGQLEWRQGNPDRARQIFEQGLDAVGPSSPLLAALAELELRLKNIRRAREIFERLRAVAPRHLPALVSAAQMEHRAGNTVRAQRLYDEAVAVVAAGSMCDSEGGGWPRQPWHRSGPPAEAPEKGTDVGREQAGLEGVEGEARVLHRSNSHRNVLDSDATDPCKTVARPDISAKQEAMAATGNPTTSQAHTLTLQAASAAVVLHARAQSCLRDGDIAGAERLLAAVEAIEPANGHLCHTRGLLCQGEGEVAAAEVWFRRGMGGSKSAEGTLLCYEGLAELLAFKGLKEEARAVWQAGLAAVHPTTSRYLRQAALFEKKERNWAAAAALFADAVRRDPQDYRSWLQWAVFERRQRHYDSAERCFQQGVTVAPGNPYLWYSYASMLVALQRLPEARAVLQTATRHCPRSAPLWMEWAMMEAAAGEVETARKLFKRGSELPPSYQHAPLYQAWADLEQQQGDAAAAEGLMRRAEQVLAARRPQQGVAGSDMEQGRGLERAGLRRGTVLQESGSAPAAGTQGL